VSSPDSIARTRALHLEKTMPNFVGCRYAFRKVKVSSTPSTPYLLPPTYYSILRRRDPRRSTGGSHRLHLEPPWNALLRARRSVHRRERGEERVEEKEGGEKVRDNPQPPIDPP